MNMNILCKLGLHNWKKTASIEANPFIVEENIRYTVFRCARCSKTKLGYKLSDTRRIQ